jgi:hypothetical protein
MQEIIKLLDGLSKIESLSMEVQNLREEIATIKSSTKNAVLVPEKQISAELNISTKTLRKYRHQNILPYHKLGKRILYDRNELLQRLTDANRTDPSIRINTRLVRHKTSMTRLLNS